MKITKVKFYKVLTNDRKGIVKRRFRNNSVKFLNQIESSIEINILLPRLKRTIISNKRTEITNGVFINNYKMVVNSVFREGVKPFDLQSFLRLECSLNAIESSLKFMFLTSFRSIDSFNRSSRLLRSIISY